ncbi:MAG: DUF3303 domain-containing protein [Alphaproteobacteria bacterium]|nr:DUF3303 domain-containing protein [Alphaproteobacteria bacterium]
MLFMVIERFKDGDEKRVGERFRKDGRMMPADVVYHASWLDPRTMRCWQVMEAPTRASLDPWIEKWRDLMEFEVVPVEASADFWAKRPA